MTPFKWKITWNYVYSPFIGLFVYTEPPLTYRVTHKGWDCKDDQKLLKYDDSKVKLCILP